VKSKSLELEIPAHLAEITGLAFNSNNRIMVSSGADYLINVWNVISKSLLFEIREHLGAITYINFLEEQD
jgi:WD40 repeat protein